MGKARSKEEALPKSVIQPGSLRRRHWKRFLHAPDPELLEQLYVPALSEAIRYDRCCAYFSSSVLSAAARGFGPLIERLVSLGDRAPRPAVRLLVNEELNAADRNALLETGSSAALEKRLFDRFKSPKEALEKERLKMLAWLLREGLVAVRVGVLRSGEGILHAKYGVVTDEKGDAVVFAGSGNESAPGLLSNHEQLELSTSWSDPERLQHYTKQFDALWTDTHPDVHTVTLPEAVRLKLIKFAPKEPPIAEPSTALARQRAAMLLQYVVEAPYFENGGSTCDATALVDLWPHQRRVVEETATAWPDGRLLCDEVGMGKTIEAILVLRRLLAGRGVKRALLLVPRGLLKQWQGELREKGGLVVPRLEGLDRLVWPNEVEKRLSGFDEALQRDVLLVSRETARTEANRALLLTSDVWDLVILDESHAARRRKQEENEFNGATLLLELLRELQLRGRVRGVMLLSATPMQTHPWEPWDLLAILGEGGRWLAEFREVRNFYGAVRSLSNGSLKTEEARVPAELVVADAAFPPPSGAPRPTDATAFAKSLSFAKPDQREPLARWLRHGAPLARKMHRNTRDTLRAYYAMGLLNRPPPKRAVHDERFDYEHLEERRVYDAVKEYIDHRYAQLETDKPGKGFVMTVYRRRAASSPYALQESLKRRRAGLRAVIARHTLDDWVRDDFDPSDLDEDDEFFDRVEITDSYPDDPGIARNELNQVEELLAKLAGLGSRDTKLSRFYDIIKALRSEGRAVLVFSEYTDTMEYVSERLTSLCGDRLGTYSGDGGRRRVGDEWKPATKDVITSALMRGEIDVLVCTDAASEGLNLQRASAVVNYDLPWNPSKVEQRIGRVDRIGQEQDVVKVTNLFLIHSVDDDVYSALRHRCGLFEKFVGPMQPVLSRARRMLTGRERAQRGVIEQEAATVDAEPIATENYLESEAVKPEPVTSPATRADLMRALLRLTGEFGPKAAQAKQSHTVRITNAGSAGASFSGDRAELERDESLKPLSPLDDNLRGLMQQLRRTGERLPLVVGTAQAGSFRRTVCRWLAASGIEAVATFDELRSRVDGWDGVYPDPARHVDAEREAQREAERQVRAMERDAAATVRRNLGAQREAARLRLLRELGRYLVCASRSAAPLNDRFHQQMTGAGPAAERLRKCFTQLGEKYPEWPNDLVMDFERFASEVNEARRKSRLAGKEIDAALGDPRWKAADALASLRRSDARD